MIKITNLSKSYGKTKIVDDLNLEIKKGSIFGFLGPNGAGKTTTIKMIVGLSKPQKGIIEIGGKPISKNREIIGFMPEDPYFYDHLTALEFLNFMKNLFTITNGDSEKMLKKVGLEKAAKEKIENFSKGMKQRLGLAQAIINDPDYIFLDEPLDGLDPIGRREFKEILLDIKKRGKTIFFNSHILSDVEEICDQIGIINKGKLIYSGDVKGFCKNKSLEDAFVDKLISK
ncbi:MAG: ABC transporter ATP-binding protein [Patescibacteria group bacterium]